MHQSIAIRGLPACWHWHNLKTPGLQKYLQQNLALDVERLDTLSAAPYSDSKVAPAFNENVLSLISAYGLGLQAMGSAKVTSFSASEKIRREKMWKEKTKWFAAAAACCALGAGVGFGSWFLQDTTFAKSQADEKPHNDSVIATAKRLDTDWEGLATSNSAERTIISNILSLRTMIVLAEAHRDRGQHHSRQDPTSCDQPDLASLDQNALKKIPRGERKMVVIDSMTFDYLADATSAIDPKTDLTCSVAQVAGNARRGGARGVPGGGMGMMPGEMPGAMGMEGMGMGGPAMAAQPAPDAAAATNAPHALLVTLTCRTPFRASTKSPQYRTRRGLRAAQVRQSVAQASTERTNAQNGLRHYPGVDHLEQCHQGRPQRTSGNQDGLPDRFDREAHRASPRTPHRHGI